MTTLRDKIRNIEMSFKFDSRRAAMLYVISLDGGCDCQAGDVENSDGWFGLIGRHILCEDSQSFISVDSFDTPGLAQAEFDTRDKPTPDFEADAFITEERRGYHISIEGGFVQKHARTFEEATAQLRAWTETSGYFPNVWAVNERGNTTLLERTDDPANPYTATDISYV